MLIVSCLNGCARTERALNQVLVDFGLHPRPETDAPDVEADIMSRLADITEKELGRFSANPVNTEVEFEKIPGNPLGLGNFYKIVKIYEEAYPLEVTRQRVPQVQHTETLRKRGYRARVEYRYRIFRGKAFPTRDEARDGAADIRTDEVGREIYLYHFDETGVWDGEPGRLERRLESPEAGRARVPSPARDAQEDHTVKEVTVGGTLRVRGERVGVVEE